MRHVLTYCTVDFEHAATCFALGVCEPSFFRECWQQGTDGVDAWSLRGGGLVKVAVRSPTDIRVSGSFRKSLVPDMCVDIIPNAKEAEGYRLQEDAPTHKSVICGTPPPPPHLHRIA